MILEWFKLLNIDAYTTYPNIKKKLSYIEAILKNQKLPLFIWNRM